MTITANRRLVANSGGTALVFKLDTLHGLLDVQAGAPTAGQGPVWDLEALGVGLAGFKYDDFLKLTLSGSPYVADKILLANGNAYIDISLATAIVNVGGEIAYVPLAEQSSNPDTVPKGVLVPVNTTTGPITVPPPPSVLNSRFCVVDSRGTAGDNNITISFGAALFHGVNQNYVINTENGSAEFLYLGSPIGWVKLS
jgi:hypothetical protein